MPLTQAQLEKPVLTPAQRRELAQLPPRAIMALNQWERAEVLAYLESNAATFWIKANTPEDVRFSIEPSYAWDELQVHVIPGGDQLPRPFPFQVGAHVLRNLDQPQFGGRSQVQGPYVPGEPREIISVPGDDDKLSFWLQLPGEPPPMLELPGVAGQAPAAKGRKAPPAALIVPGAPGE